MHAIQPRLATICHSILRFTIGMPGCSVRKVLARLDLMLKVRRERQQLAELDDRMLKDIGLSRSLAHLETGRSALDIPERRLELS